MKILWFKVLFLFILLSTFLWAGKVHVSSNGISWTTYEISDSDSNNLIDIVYGDGTYVAVGVEGTVMVSTDAQNWSNYSLSDTLTLYSVAYGNGIFVAVASETIFQNNDGATYAYYSSDGTSWTRVSLPMSDWVGKISYENGNFYVAGANGILASSDGNTWETVYLQDNIYLVDIAYDNGTYVATGYFGRVLTSNDAASWTLDSTSPGYWLKSNDHFNSKFIAVDGFGNILVSSDSGATWDAAQISGVSSLEDVQSNNDGVVIVGGSGMVAYSTDADNWTTYDLGETQSIGSITYGDGQFVALQGALVGSGGSISIDTEGSTDVLLEENELNITILEDGAYVFNLSDINISETLESIKFVSLETAGNLYYKSGNVALDDEINVSDLSNLVFVPDVNAYGGDPYSSMIFQENNGSGYSDTNYTVNIFVTAVNDPVILALSDYNVTLDVNQSDSITLSYSDPDTDANSIYWSYSSSNTDLIPLSGISLDDSGSNKVLSFSPLSDQYGTAIISVTASDGELETVAKLGVNVLEPSTDIPTTPTIPDENQSTPEENGVFELNLIKGWNLLSLPVYTELTSADLLSVFNIAEVEKLFKFSGVTENWMVWCNYYYSEKCSNSLQFSMLNSREGFWVKTNEDVNVTLEFDSELVNTSDTYYSNDVPSILATWTLGGANRDIDSNTLAQLLNGKAVNVNAGRQVRAIFKYDTQNKNWLVFSPIPEFASQIASQYTSFGSVERTEGFWIKSEEK